MSRIGRHPIDIPAGVTVTIADGNVVTVKGPKGTLTESLHPRMEIVEEGTHVFVKRPTDEAPDKALHGLTRTLIANMITGVTTGFSKALEINGVGYRAALNGKTLVLNLGHSHPINIVPSATITFEVPDANHILVKGADKQEVGQIAAVIRSKRPPEPYLGKGVKYATETIRRKAGKTGK